MASEEAMQAFIAAGGEKPRREKPSPSESKSQLGIGRKQGLNRGAGPRRRKAFQEVPPERRGFWHGAMCTKLRAQEKEEGFAGFYRCECGDPECDAQVEGFDEARRFFVPGHLKPRASFNHRGFRFGYVATLGPDDPTNIVPIAPRCNESEFWKRNQSQPEWTARKEAG